MNVQQAVQKLRREGFKRLDKEPLTWKKVHNQKVCTAVVVVDPSTQGVKVFYHAA